MTFFFLSLFENLNEYIQKLFEHLFMVLIFNNGMQEKIPNTRRSKNKPTRFLRPRVWNPTLGGHLEPVSLERTERRRPLPPSFIYPLPNTQIHGRHYTLPHLPLLLGFYCIFNSLIIPKSKFSIFPTDCYSHWFRHRDSP